MGKIHQPLHGSKLLPFLNDTQGVIAIKEQLTVKVVEIQKVVHKNPLHRNMHKILQEIHQPLHRNMYESGRNPERCS